MKHVLVFLLCVSFSTVALSQTTSSKAVKKYVLLEITEQDGKITAVDTVMENTTGNMKFDNFQFLGSASADAPNSHNLVEIEFFDAFDQLDSINMDLDKVYVGQGMGVYATSGHVSHAISDMVFSFEEKENNSKEIRKEIQILNEKVAKMLRDMEARFKKLEKEN